jgi:NaMN:DMB phosphoribosyltransferase
LEGSGRQLIGGIREFGGLEIAMMAGAVLGAASQRRPALISSAAALAAIRLCPAARDYCVFAHRSAEKDHDIVLATLDAKPLLDLGLRLVEGARPTEFFKRAETMDTDVVLLAKEHRKMVAEPGFGR